MLQLEPELGLSALDMLPQQLLADADLEIVQALFEHVLERQGPLALDDRLDAIWTAAARSEEPRIGHFLLATYPGLSPNSCIYQLHLGEYFLGPGLPLFAAVSQELLQQQLPLMRELTVRVQTHGSVNMVQRLLLQELSPEAAFNMLSYFNSMVSSEPLSYAGWREATGQQVLEVLQSYTDQQRALILIGLGYNDPLPELDDLGDAYPLLDFCAGYHSLEVVAPLIRKLEEVDIDDVPEIALHAACLFGRLQTIEWILTHYPGARYHTSEWADNLETAPGRQQVVEILRRYPFE